MTDEVLPDVFNESVIITWSNAFCYAPSPLPQKGLNWILITAQFYSQHLHLRPRSIESLGKALRMVYNKCVIVVVSSSQANCGFFIMAICIMYRHDKRRLHKSKLQSAKLVNPFIKHNNAYILEIHINFISNIFQALAEVVHITGDHHGYIMDHWSVGLPPRSAGSGLHFHDIHSFPSEYSKELHAISKHKCQKYARFCMCLKLQFNYSRIFPCTYVDLESWM